MKLIKDWMYSKSILYYSKKVRCWNLRLSDKMLSLCFCLFKSPNKIPWYTLILIKTASPGMYEHCSLSFSHSNWLILFMVWNPQWRSTLLWAESQYVELGPHLKVHPPPVGRHCCKFSTMHKPLRRAGLQGHTAAVLILPLAALLGRWNKQRPGILYSLIVS